MFSSDVRNQLLATLTGKKIVWTYKKKLKNIENVHLVNILQIGFGAVLGWPSASLLVLESQDSPLPTGPLTVQQTSAVSSYMYLGGSLGCLFFGWTLNQYGRKYNLMGAAILQLVNVYFHYKTFNFNFPG